MSVRTLQRTDGATFYCTFTCWNWLPLIERTNTYDHIYRWMHIVKAKGCRIFGYVVMPNHVHLLLHTPEGRSINALLANAKRFLAYEIRSRLVDQCEHGLLVTLKAAVRPSDAARGQVYRMFMPSSDIQEFQLSQGLRLGTLRNHNVMMNFPYFHQACPSAPSNALMAPRSIARSRAGTGYPSLSGPTPTITSTDGCT